MKPKILFTASIPLHFKAFHLPYLKWFQEQGYETHVACNGFENLPYVDKYWNINFNRSPLGYQNISAFRRLKKLIDREKFILINCHTPMVGVLTRFASISARKKGTKLIYTAHGFHFFKGASIINWLVYYPVELILSSLTDAIICINNEDFKRIQKRGSKSCDYYLIPGIGVEGSRFYIVSEEVKHSLRIKNGISKSKFILIYAAEFINRKNHEFIINSFLNNIKKLEDIQILFAGRGKLEKSLKKLTNKYSLDNHIKFIGFRKDIDLIYKMSDIGVSSSKQEGLGLNLVEEMMCGLPVIATIDRGHKEVVDHAKNGYLFEQDNSDEFIKYILDLKTDINKYNLFSLNAIEKSSKFEIKNSLYLMSKIYLKYLN